MRLLALLLLAAPVRAERLIQIGIVPSADKLTLACDGKCAVPDSEGRAQSLTPDYPYDVEATDDGLRIGPIDSPDEVKISPREDEDAVLINKKRYRGTVILRKNAHGAVTAIAELGIEDYLTGVLPQEVDPAWPIEALKAQAVVARTFAYTQLGKYKKDGFDLTSDTRSQMYGGSGHEYPSVRKAVVSTNGEVLGYKGQILNVFYHSICGGHTANMGDVWPSSAEVPKPLRGVRDKYCKVIPSDWTAFFRDDDILAVVLLHHPVSGKLRRFEIDRKDNAGYVRDFTLKIGDETLRVTANDLRQWLGPSKLRSALISRIRKSGGGIEFIGRGSGHGVGLCQWGAKVQADKGRKYEKILDFYFPGSTLSVVDE